MSPAENELPTKKVRISLEIPVSLTFPDESLPPTRIEGRTLDLSMDGLRVTTRSVTSEYYKKTFRWLQHVQLEFPQGAVGELIRLRGKIVWMDHASQGNKPLCTLGIAFEDLPDEQSRQLRDAVMTLLRDILATDNKSLDSH